MDGRVVELDPPKVFAFLWGKDLLRLELAPEGDGTRLTLIQTLEADEAARNAAGWHVCLDKLAGEDTDWEPLYEEYQRRGVRRSRDPGSQLDADERQRRLGRDRVRTPAAATSVTSTPV